VYSSSSFSLCAALTEGESRGNTPGEYTGAPETTPLHLVPRRCEGDDSRLPVPPRQLLAFAVGSGLHPGQGPQAGGPLDADAHRPDIPTDVQSGRVDLAALGSRVFDIRQAPALGALTAPLLINSFDAEEKVLGAPVAERMIREVDGGGLTGVDPLRSRAACATPSAPGHHCWVRGLQGTHDRHPGVQGRRIHRSHPRSETAMVRRGPP
jgi:hypothetical protein